MTQIHTTDSLFTHINHSRSWVICRVIIVVTTTRHGFVRKCEITLGSELGACIQSPVSVFWDVMGQIVCSFVVPIHFRDKAPLQITRNILPQCQKQQIYFGLHHYHHQPCKQISIDIDVIKH